MGRTRSASQDYNIARRPSREIVLPQRPQNTAGGVVKRPPYPAERSRRAFPPPFSLLPSVFCLLSSVFCLPYFSSNRNSCGGA